MMTVRRCKGSNRVNGSILCFKS